MKRKNILITGGAGFIGSHVNKMLFEAGHNTIILDNLSSGSKQSVIGGNFIKGDLGDKSLLNEVFSKYTIDVVMHLAASIDVGESVINPGAYYDNNVVNTYHLLEAMRLHSVKTIIFSSTAALFGIPERLPIDETHPLNPINPYGRTKIMGEQMLDDYKSAYGIRYCSLRYFNAAGADPDLEIKYIPKKEHNLIPIIFQKMKENNPVTIFGNDYPTPDGTCIRDYIHIMDIGLAHILAMEKLFENGKSGCYNLGNGKGFSVKEVVDTVEEVTGQKVLVKEGKRREGDPPILYADSALARRELGWTPRFSSLQEIVLHAWKARSGTFA